VSDPLVPVIVRSYVPSGVVEAVETVSVEPTDPPAGGVAGFGAKLALASAGSPLASSVVAELKPFTLSIVAVYVVEPPGTTVRKAGAAESVKSGVATTSSTVVVCVIDPLVALIVSVEVPSGVVTSVATVRVEPTDPPGGGPTGFGENAALDPSGSPLTSRVVAALKPFRLPTVAV
jgi:hypothetical protein